MYPANKRTRQRKFIAPKRWYSRDDCQEIQAHDAIFESSEKKYKYVK